MKMIDVRKILRHALILTMLVLLAAISAFVTSAAELSDNAVMILSGEIAGQEITVDAVLKQNSGLNGMTAEISYDTAALTLTGVERGEALSSLEYMTTNVDTEEGYAITPFKVIWSGDDNDASTGRILRMRFSINDGAKDGVHAVTIKADATYTDGDVGTKKVLVNGVKIKTKGNQPQSVITEAESEEGGKNPHLLPIISISVVAATGIAFSIVFIIKRKGRKAWTKIE